MLITTDEQLRTYLPNALTTVEGEASMYEKIEPFLRKAETWLTRNFLGEEVTAQIEDAEETDELRSLCCHITALDAFRRAIPSLDLILTPNGFGIVSNQNVVPASADRVNRLIDSLLSNRDDLASDLLVQLGTHGYWLTSVQAAFFGATLWPNLELATLAGFNSDKWTHYKSLRLRAITIEQELAENFISEELMARLRRNMLMQRVTAEERMIIDSIRQTTLEMLAGKPLDFKRMVSAVQRIRTRPIVFPEWQDSYTSMLFCRPSFQNTKDSGGYWF